MVDYDLSDDADLAEHFQFLDDLRESGAINMFGAAPYLQEEFGLTKTEARVVLQAWMRSFDRDTPAAERARQVTA